MRGGLRHLPPKRYLPQQSWQLHLWVWGWLRGRFWQSNLHRYVSMTRGILCILWLCCLYTGMYVWQKGILGMLWLCCLAQMGRINTECAVSFQVSIEAVGIWYNPRCSVLDNYQFVYTFTGKWVKHKMQYLVWDCHVCEICTSGFGDNTSILF